METEFDYKAFCAAIDAVAEDFDADVYYYKFGIDDTGLGHIVSEFPAEKARPNGLLILTTNGGLANSAFQIARFFQHSYEDFAVYIPSYCKSAGTLLSIGAHKIIMGPLSELGPLDVQLYERDEIFSRKSGLLMHSAMESLKRESFELYEHFLLSIKARSGDNISFPVASQVATSIVNGVMSPIYAQISPNTIGGDYRDLRVAIEYGRRLANVSGNISSQNVRILTEGYPSHDFIIDLLEAKALFNTVELPSANLYRLMSFMNSNPYMGADDNVILCLNSLSREISAEEVDADGNGGGSSDENDPEPGLDDSSGPDRGDSDGEGQSVPAGEEEAGSSSVEAEGVPDQNPGEQAHVDRSGDRSAF